MKNTVAATIFDHFGDKLGTSFLAVILMVGSPDFSFNELWTELGKIWLGEE